MKLYFENHFGLLAPIDFGRKNKQGGHILPHFRRCNKAIILGTEVFFKVCVKLNDAFYSFAYCFFYLIPIYFIFGRAIVMMFRRPIIIIKIKI